jgi:hypothetical protein
MSVAGCVRRGRKAPSLAILRNATVPVAYPVEEYSRCDDSSHGNQWRASHESTLASACGTRFFFCIQP